jgi:hypothetical protein
MTVTSGQFLFARDIHGYSQLDFPHFGFGGSADCPEDVLSCNELEGLVDR